MKAVQLPDRGIVKVAGEAARRFLNGLLTADIDKVGPGAPRYAALLTPQGKVIADAIVAEAPAEDGGGFFLDCPRALAPRLADRLTFYKLRAKVTIEDLSGTLAVLAAWDGAGTTRLGLLYPDPRLEALGLRLMVPAELAAGAIAELGAEATDAATYEAHRIALAVPSGGIDFAYGDAFPHEADMDQLHGVDFAKGCYVGQEVVSRMEHRGRARTRVVPVAFEDAAPGTGAEVAASGRPVGTLGSAAGRLGLALLRLDRVDEALAAGLALTAGGVPVRLGPKPGWARFPFPGEPRAAE